MGRSASELFVVQFAVRLGFTQLAQKSAFLFSGPIGWILSQFATRFLGYLVEQGIIILDIALMHRQVNIEEKDYRNAIYRAYIASKGEVISDEDKEKLRQAVIDATRRFVRVRVYDDSNP